MSIGWLGADIDSSPSPSPSIRPVITSSSTPFSSTDQLFHSMLDGKIIDGLRAESIIATEPGGE